MNHNLPVSPLAHSAPLPQLRLATVDQLCSQHPGLTPPAARTLIHRAEQNGLKKHVYRVGRRVYVDLIGFEHWVRSGGAA